MAVFHRPATPVVTSSETGSKFSNEKFPNEPEPTVPEPTWGPYRSQRRWIFNFFENPTYSTASYLVSIFIMAVIVVSTTSFCCETIPEWKDWEGWVIIESTSIAIFTVEYTLRLSCSPEPREFVKQGYNMIDFVAIFPFYLELATNVAFSGTRVLRAVRLLRVIRVFRLSKYSQAMQVMNATMIASIRPLGMFIFFVLLSLVLFSAAMYYAEQSDEDTDFKSIPHAFWWTVVTLTTVGYGDEIPRTVPGKLIASAAMLSGLVILALPITVIGSNFAQCVAEYEAERQRRELITETVAHEIEALEGSTRTLKVPHSPGGSEIKDDRGTPSQSGASLTGGTQSGTDKGPGSRSRTPRAIGGTPADKEKLDERFRHLEQMKRRLLLQKRAVVSRRNLAIDPAWRLKQQGISNMSVLDDYESIPPSIGEGTSRTTAEMPRIGPVSTFDRALSQLRLSSIPHGHSHDSAMRFGMGMGMGMGMVPSYDHTAEYVQQPSKLKYSLSGVLSPQLYPSNTDPAQRLLRPRKSGTLLEREDGVNSEPIGVDLQYNDDDTLASGRSGGRISNYRLVPTEVNTAIPRRSSFPDLQGFDLDDASYSSATPRGSVAQPRRGSGDSDPLSHDFKVRHFSTRHLPSPPSSFYHRGPTRPTFVSDSLLSSSTFATAPRSGPPVLADGSSSSHPSPSDQSGTPLSFASTEHSRLHPQTPTISENTSGVQDPTTANLPTAFSSRPRTSSDPTIGQSTVTTGHAARLLQDDTEAEVPATTEGEGVEYNDGQSVHLLKPTETAASEGTGGAMKISSPGKMELGFSVGVRVASPAVVDADAPASSLRRPSEGEESFTTLTEPSYPVTHLPSTAPTFAPTPRATATAPAAATPIATATHTPAGRGGATKIEGSAQPAGPGIALREDLTHELLYSLNRLCFSMQSMEIQISERLGAVEDRLARLETAESTALAAALNPEQVSVEV